MALVKPPKDYYRLAEIAEECQCTVEDLLDYGEQGRLVICIRLRHNAVAYYVEEDGDRQYSIDLYPEFLSGLYPLSPYSLGSVRRSEPISSVGLCPQEKNGAIDGWRLDKPFAVVLPDSSSLVITHDEKKRFKEKYCLGVAGNQEEVQTQDQVPEKDSEMVTRLKLEKTENVEIAGMLKKAFPKTTHHRIGKLITMEPGDNASRGAYRKRGKRLLKLYSEKPKQNE